MAVHATEDLLEWELAIKAALVEDSGLYECQVNTNPLSQLRASLAVTRE